MLPRLLDLENQRDDVWADSVYSDKYFQDLLILGGFESLIHEKGARNHPLNEASKKLNRIKAITRACVKHVFGCMTMPMDRSRSADKAWFCVEALTRPSTARCVKKACTSALASAHGSTLCPHPEF